MALASFLTALFYERNLSPLLVHGDGSCLFHATNAAHQALDNNTDIIPSPDLRLAACTLARDFLLSNTSLCTEQNLLELENSLDESEDVFNELIFLSLATIRNGEIIILNEMGKITSYTPHTDMKQILLQGKEHPLPPRSDQEYPKSPSSSSIDHQLFLSTMMPHNQRFAYSDHQQLFLLAKSPTLRNLLLPQMILKIIQHSQNYSPHR